MSLPFDGSPEESEDPAANAPLVTPEPLFTVISGSPTDEELAALTAVVVSLQPEAGIAGHEPEHSIRQRAWGRRELARKRLSPGFGAWKRGAH